MPVQFMTIDLQKEIIFVYLICWDRIRELHRKLLSILFQWYICFVFYCFFMFFIYTQW